MPKEKLLGVVELLILNLVDRDVRTPSQVHKEIVKYFDVHSQSVARTFTKLVNNGMLRKVSRKRVGLPTKGKGIRKKAKAYKLTARGFRTLDNYKSLLKSEDIDV